MSKSLLIGAVRRAVPDVRSGIADVIVARILELIAGELERMPLDGAVLRVLPELDEETVGKITTEVLAMISQRLSHQNKSLAQAVIRAIPEAQGGMAHGIVESILDTISAELVSQGSFTLQKIGSLTLRHKTKGEEDIRDPGEGDGNKRLPGVSARYHVSRFLSDQVRSAAAGRIAVAVIAVAANDSTQPA